MKPACPLKSMNERLGQLLPLLRLPRRFWNEGSKAISKALAFIPKRVANFAMRDTPEKYSMSSSCKAPSSSWQIQWVRMTSQIKSLARTGGWNAPLRDKISQVSSGHSNLRRRQSTKWNCSGVMFHVKVRLSVQAAAADANMNALQKHKLLHRFDIKQVGNTIMQDTPRGQTMWKLRPPCKHQTLSPSSEPRRNELFLKAQAPPSPDRRQALALQRALRTQRLPARQNVAETGCRIRLQD